MDTKLTKKSWLMGILLFHIILMTAGPSWGTLSGALDYRVESIEDDAEQIGSSVNIYINDLELGQKQCGIRFRHVKIPKGSTITNAYIQFTVDQASSDDTDLTIWGENANSAKLFENIDNDISSRVKTSASVAWNDVPSWGSDFETGVAQQTRI